RDLERGVTLERVRAPELPDEERRRQREEHPPPRERPHQAALRAASGRRRLAPSRRRRFDTGCTAIQRAQSAARSSASWRSTVPGRAYGAITSSPPTSVLNAAS